MRTPSLYLTAVCRAFVDTHARVAGFGIRAVLPSACVMTLTFGAAAFWGAFSFGLAAETDPKPHVLKGSPTNSTTLAGGETICAPGSNGVLSTFYQSSGTRRMAERLHLHIQNTGLKNPNAN